jgi:chromosome segregation ATPase
MEASTEQSAATRSQDAVDAGADPKIPFFGARAKARELAGEAAALRMERDRLTAEVASLREQQERLGVLSVVQLEQRRAALSQEIEEQATQVAARREAAANEHARQLDEYGREEDKLRAELDRLRQQVVVTEETALLQEVGVYEYRHPLSDSVAYQAEIKRLQDEIKAMTRKDGGAVLTTTNWTVNGSAVEGRKMVRDFSKLMLRAYNAESDSLVRSLKPYKLASAVERLAKVSGTIERLGKTMDIRIAAPYHRLRVKELELTADHREKLAEEKEREREERQRLREEKLAQQEIERERVRLEKERDHYANALKALEEKGDQDAAQRVREQLGDLQRAIEDVEYRAANIRAGYVYVISNVGAFGDGMVKIGMTRRLEPLDRVRELGDASVPFRYDVHALFFSDDAVGIETELHRRLGDRRVNRVNTRREFFYATPNEVKGHLIELAGELLQFDELPEAVEYHQSVNQRPASD